MPRKRKTSKYEIDPALILIILLAICIAGFFIGLNSGNWFVVLASVFIGVLTLFGLIRQIEKETGVHIVEPITRKLFGERQPVEIIKKGHVPEVRSKILTEILYEVKNFKAHVPRIRGKQKEKQYTLALTSYLAHSFPQIEMDQPLGKGNRIDAIIGNIGIEAKYRPDQNEINRLYGQIDTYLQFLDDIIVVFFDSDSNAVNDFKKKLKRGGYSEKVSVVNV